MPRTLLLATDHKQSVITEVGDAKPNSIRYCAYGQPSATQAIVARLAFNGAFRERSIGWYFLGNGYRIYNPVLRCFHSPDSWSPFGLGGLNTYRYCGGDPVNNSDPSGHMRKAASKFFGLPKKRGKSPSPPPELEKNASVIPNSYVDDPTKNSVVTHPTSSTQLTRSTLQETIRPAEVSESGTHISREVIDRSVRRAHEAAEKEKLAEIYRKQTETYQDDLGDWQIRVLPSAPNSPKNVRDPNQKS